MRQRIGNGKQANVFWKEVAAALPPEVRERYATTLATGARVEYAFDLAIAAWRVARQALATGCRAGARNLRRAARSLDAAARRGASRLRTDNSSVSMTPNPSQVLGRQSSVAKRRQS